MILATSLSSASPHVKEVGAGEFQVTFSVRPEAGAKTVHLAGEFNGWSMTALPMAGPDSDGRFTAALPLKKGRYEYKFVCDGSRWAADPENPNPPGSYGNSVLFVGISPEAAKPNPPPTTPPKNMAARVEHPPEVTEGLKAYATWNKKRHMPWFSDRAVSFVHPDATAEAVRLMIHGAGYQMGYNLERAAGEDGLWCLSLDRAQLGDRLGYVLEVKRGDRWERVLDPNAYSVTSRGGRAVGLVAPPSDDRGRVELIPAFKSSSNSLLPRDLYVYLPPGYSKTAAPRYVVLYMHDGQNCWDDPVDPFGAGGWQVNLTADRLIREGKVKPFIVVALANTPQRMTDYGPGPDVCDAAGQAYIRFLVEEVKPMIDRRYRTLPDPANTAIMGSSMGGLISFQAVLLRPDVFGMAGVVSPAFWYKDGKGQGYAALLEKAAPAARGRVRIYMDSGTAGPSQDGAPDTRRMGEALIQAGWKEGVDIVRFEDQGAQHNERAWRARVHRPLEFMFGK